MVQEWLHNYLKLCDFPKLYFFHNFSLLWYYLICKLIYIFSHQEFVLHMDDQISGHGFLPVYTGSDTSHISTGLRRNASYKFRLQAQNEEGKSPWSDEVSYYTLPDVPGPPLRPASKGRLHPHSFKVLMCIFESNNCFSILHLLIWTYIKNYCNIFIAIKLQCLLICILTFVSSLGPLGSPIR